MWKWEILTMEQYEEEGSGKKKFYYFEENVNHRCLCIHLKKWFIIT
jgi:hypothetical protein